MIFGSVCSGIEAASVAWHPLGWRAAFLSEIEAFPRAVLRHRYPDVPMHGDFTTIRAGDYDPIDLLVGGTPCQPFSIAGLRAGLADDRGNLAIEFLRLAQRLRPRWLVWENVPGVLSSLSHDAPGPNPPPPPVDLERDGQAVETEDEHTGEELHAFLCFLAGLSEVGYGYAYRSYDAQYFRLAQRRERVFVVGYLGDWRPAAAVLFEPESLSGNPAPRREARKGSAVSPPLGAGSGGRKPGLDVDTRESLIAGVTPTLTHKPYGDDASREGLLVAGTLTGGRQSAPEAERGRLITGTMAGYPESGREAHRSQLVPIGADRVVPTVDANFGRLHGASGQDLRHGHGHLVAFGGNNTSGPIDVAAALLARNGSPARMDFESETFIAFDCKAGGSHVGFNIGDLPGALRGDGHAGGHAAVAFKPSHYTRDKDGAPSEIYPPLSADADKGDQDPVVLAFDPTQITHPENRSKPKPGGPAPTLAKGVHPPAVAVQTVSMAVRRLTPLECERLQGFPDGWTAIPYRGKPAADGPRYRALGNSMAVPCMAWIGQRIDAVQRRLTTLATTRAAE